MVASLLRSDAFWLRTLVAFLCSIALSTRYSVLGIATIHLTCQLLAHHRHPQQCSVQPSTAAICSTSQLLACHCPQQRSVQLAMCSKLLTSQLLACHRPQQRSVRHCGQVIMFLILEGRGCTFGPWYPLGHGQRANWSILVRCYTTIISGKL
jgi:hypothetical protein